MKAVLPVLWILKNACRRLSVIFNNLEYRILDTVDGIDFHYADKRWAKVRKKINKEYGVE